MATRTIEVGETVGHYRTQEACGIDNGHHGCAEHPDVFMQNNITMVGHMEEPGDHVRLWNCAIHGPEVP